MVISSIQIVVTIFLLMFAGYFFAMKGWFKDGGDQLLSKLVVQFGVPATVVSNMMANYTREDLIHSWLGIVLPLITLGSCYALAILIARILKLPQNRRGVFCVMFAFSNSVFIGLPVATAIFGDDAVPFALLYYISNTLMFWTIGYRGLQADGGHRTPLFSRETVKSVMSPALISFVLCIALILCGVTLPKFIMDTAKYAGGVVTPLSMLFIGFMLHKIGITKIRVTRDIFIASCGRFLVAPAIAFALGAFLPLPLLMKQVFVIQASMPVMSQSSIIASRTGADAEFAAIGTVFTTLFSLLFTPVLMLLIS